MSRVIECENCGQKNRVADVLPAGKVAICGVCKEPLELADAVDAIDAEVEGDQW